MEILTNRIAFGTITAALMSVCSGTSYADSMFGVVGSPIDLSANVSEAILPGGTIFQESMPLFGTSPDPKQSAELLHISSAGVNPIDRSFSYNSNPSISGAFTSSLAESNGNGGVGVSQLILASPGGTDPNSIRQLVAQSLWTQTFLYTGTPTVDLRLHLEIPLLLVDLWLVPPNRDFASATETAEAEARVDTTITHPDGTISKGGSFEFGLREFETQLPNPAGGFLNFADFQVLGTAGPPVAVGDDPTVVAFKLDPFSTSVDLGTLNTGDILSYVYTLTAEGTTHGFERGYQARVGDPFGVDVVSNNLTVTVTPVTGEVPEPRGLGFAVLGIAGLWLWRKRRVRLP
jgi:MYXO-CTERM domain-containing protein